MKRILITGASRGIGRAVAEVLAEEGNVLFLHGRERDALNATAKAVEGKGARGIPLSYDLRDISRIEKLVAAIGEDPLDVLVNNAGVAIVKSLESISLQDWESTVATNITAPFLLTQKLAPRMKAGASIVNILSIAAKTGFANWSCYCMSKFALEGFSQSIREELRPRGIRVINIYPAATDTEIWHGLEGNWQREKMLPANAVAQAVAHALKQPARVAVENISLSDVGGSL
jgi:short-subunit dehydrogenase